jgi:hypothetical protein
MKRFLPFALIVLAACNVFAEERGGVITDGNSLAEGIRALKKVEAGKPLTGNEDMMVAAATNYLSGFLASSQIWSSLGKIPPFKLPDNGIPVIQFVRVVEKYLSDNPRKLHEQATVLVFAALIENFPDPAYKK